MTTEPVAGGHGIGMLAGVTGITTGLASTFYALWRLVYPSRWADPAATPRTFVAATGSVLLLAGGALVVAALLRRDGRGMRPGAVAMALGALLAGAAWGLVLHRWRAFWVLELPWAACAALVPLGLAVWLAAISGRRQWDAPRSSRRLLAAGLAGGLLGGGLATTVRWPSAPVGWFSPYTHEERVMLGLLRSLSMAQEHWKANINIDPDNDTLYAYGLAEEMTGRQVTRAGFSMATAPWLDARRYLPHDKELRYHFILYLPAEGGPLHDRNAWGPTGRALLPMSQEWMDRQEKYWCAYAWPATDAPSGTRACFVDSAGEIYVTEASATPYRGPTPPPPHAAKVAGSAPADWDLAPNGIAASGATAHDGNRWMPAGG